MTTTKQKPVEVIQFTDNIGFGMACREIGAKDTRAKQAIMDYWKLSPEDKELFWTYSGNYDAWKRVEGYNDLFVFVPRKKQIVRISEGTGDNLLDEDIEDGVVDYIDYQQYELDGEIIEDDGGELMLKEYVRDKYECLAKCVPDVLDMAYGNKSLNYIILA